MASAKVGTPAASLQNGLDQAGDLVSVPRLVGLAQAAVEPRQLVHALQGRRPGLLGQGRRGQQASKSL
jgi:hypothetical protein